jgi:sodium/potassium/calcium exchanger 6
MIVSPFWFAYYIYVGHDVNMFASNAIVYFFSFWLLGVFVGACILRYAPGGEGRMSMAVATPIALYGFLMAATWIDYVADHLVDVLNFCGIVLRIPGSIMGLTILAWGNSMADLSANITMARKGLANMAMTACFAGPVFNILIGLGLGFSSLAAQTGNSSTTVSVGAPVMTGFIFIILNCIAILVTGIFLGKGRIESYYGYIAVGLYTVYVIASISLQFSKYGESD